MASKRERVRADGTIAYIATFRHHGRQTSETFNTPTARDRFIRNLDRVGPGAAIRILDATDNTHPDTPTLTTIATEHVNLITASDYTKRRYHGYIRNDLATIGDLPVDALTTETIEGWVNGMREAGAAPKTIHNKHGFLASVLNRAVRRNLIPANPCEDVRLPKVRKPQVDVLDANDLARFLDHLPTHYHPLVLLLAGTGMRWGEATALTAADVDLEHGRINIRQAWKLNNAGWELDETKTVKSDRVVTIGPELVRVLTPLVDGRPGDALVFTTRGGGPVRHTYFHDDVWTPAVALVNGEDPWPDRKRAVKSTSMWVGIRPAEVPLGKRPKPHSLRHTAASHMLAEGLDLKTVQDQLGHESIQTTANVYGHVGAAQRAALMVAQAHLLSRSVPEVLDGPEVAEIEA